MFPEFRDLITRLKTEGSNTRFLNLFEKHNQLDHEITALESHNASGIHSDIETLKEGARVRFEIEQGPKGLLAQHIRADLDAPTDATPMPPAGDTDAADV
jgi:uncharacterized protein YdcH (DUF465 family)